MLEITPSPLVVIGPSGAGKSTLVLGLAGRRADIQFVPTWTTRPRRDGESDGHVFVDEQTFDTGTFLGTVEVFGARYGLPEFTPQARPLLLLRVFVLNMAFQVFPNARVIQVEAPIDVLSQRLRQRGSVERIDGQALSAEIEAGRRVAHAVVVSDGALDETMRRFEQAVNSVT